MDDARRREARAMLRRWRVQRRAAFNIYEQRWTVNILRDPRIFSYIIMALYALNVLRWAYERKWADAAYWLCALGITLTVTFGYKH